MASRCHVLELEISISRSRVHGREILCYAMTSDSGGGDGGQKRIVCHWANLFRIGPLLSVGHLARSSRERRYAISRHASAISGAFGPCRLSRAPWLVSHEGAASSSSDVQGHEYHD